MFFVYIMASAPKGTIYIGHTDNLVNRVFEHKSGDVKGFTQKYKCHDLVWFEAHETRDSAFKRERQMKGWNRAWKIKRIEDMNSEWSDLTDDLTDAMIGDEKRRFPSDTHLMDRPRSTAG